MKFFNHYYVGKRDKYFYKYCVKYRRYKGDNRPQFICGCHDKDTAQGICDVLNRSD